MSGWHLCIAGFWGAMCGFVLMFASQAFAVFAPVATRKFASRMRLAYLGGAFVLLSVIMILAGAMLILADASRALP